MEIKQMLSSKIKSAISDAADDPTYSNKEVEEIHNNSESICFRFDFLVATNSRPNRRSKKILFCLSREDYEDWASKFKNGNTDLDKAYSNVYSDVVEILKIEQYNLISNHKCSETPEEMLFRLKI